MCQSELRKPMRQSDLRKPLYNQLLRHPLSYNFAFTFTRYCCRT